MHLHNPLFDSFLSANIPSYLGRSLSSCQNAYYALGARLSAAPEPKLKKNKRPLSMGEGGSLPERSIQPRPTPFAPVNGQDLIAPVAGTERTGKKRGRPSKLEHEQRVREAEARGEVYPRPKKLKTPRPSLEGGLALEAHGEVSGAGAGAAPMAVMFTPNKTGPPSVASPTSGKRKRPFEKELAEDPVETSVEASAESLVGISDQLQTERGPVPQSTIPETQMSEEGVRESLLAEIRKEAEQPETLDTPMQEAGRSRPGGEVSQSTATVQGEYGSTSENPFSGHPYSGE